MKLNTILLIISIIIILMIIFVVIFGIFVIWFFQNFKKTIIDVENKIELILRKVNFYSFLGVQFSKKVSNMTASIAAVIRKFINETVKMERIASALIKNHKKILKAGYGLLTFTSKLF